MLKIYKTKQEYEAVEMFKGEVKNLTDFKSFKSFIDINASEKIIALAQEFSLFDVKEYYFINCAKEEYLQTLNSDILKACEKSGNVFLFWGKNKEFKDFFENLKYSVIEKKESFKPDFPAALVNAIQKKDKKNAWILFLKEIETKNIEEVHGVLVYAAKMSLLARSMETFDEASGIKQFQWSSTNKNTEGRDIEDIQKVYFDLIEAHAQSRSGSESLETLLEKWILNW